MERVFTLPATTPDIGEVLSTVHAQEKFENRQCLLKILSNLRFLASLVTSGEMVMKVIVTSCSYSSCVERMTPESVSG